MKIFPKNLRKRKITMKCSMRLFIHNFVHNTKKHFFSFFAAFIAFTLITKKVREKEMYFFYDKI